MKFFSVFAASLLACAAVVLPSCTKGVIHTGDETGNLYGKWVLDTKTVVTPSTSGDTQISETTFSSDHFFLCLVEPQMAFAKEGTLLTFDIDDVDYVPFSYNQEKGKITFEKIILLSAGFPPRTMQLFGTFNVDKLTDSELVLTQEESVDIPNIDYHKTTTYSYHKLVQNNQ